MLKQHDIDYINTIKNSEGIDIQTLNDIRDIAKQKEAELKKKLGFLSILAKSKKIKEQLVNNKIEMLNKEYSCWKSLIGYCVFKKIDETIPEYDACISEVTMPSEHIISKLDSTVLVDNDTKIVDVICVEGKLIVIYEDKEIKCEGPLMYTPATNYIGVKLINILNYSMTELGINQFIEIRSSKLKKTTGEEIYAHYSSYSDSTSVAYIDFEAPKIGITKNPSPIKMIIIGDNKELRMVEIDYSIDCSKEELEIKELSFSSLDKNMESKMSLVPRRKNN